MNIESQLEDWLNGIDTDVVLNETEKRCCPDYACCYPSLKWDMDKRVAFAKFYLEGDRTKPYTLTLKDFDSQYKQ